MTERLEGSKVAEARLTEVRERIQAGQSRGWSPPKLVSLHRDTSSPFSVYLKGQARSAERAGVSFQEERVPSPGGAAALLGRVEALARRSDVDAVLIEHPLPPELDFAGAVERLPLPKDVDGVSVGNLGRLLSGRPVQVPAVALAVRRILSHYHIRTRGRRVAVIGRSPTVGLPTLLLLVQRGEFADASVVLVHSQTPRLEEAIAGCEVVVSCAGKPGLLTRAVTPRDSVVIDVGLSTVPDATRPSGLRSAGDADAPDLEGWARSLTPVPGGVGPVTSAELMGNVLRAWELGHGMVAE